MGPDQSWYLVTNYINQNDQIVHGTYFTCFYFSKSAVTVNSTKVKLAGRDPPYTCVQNDSPVAAKVSNMFFYLFTTNVL